MEIGALGHRIGRSCVVRFDVGATRRVPRTRLNERTSLNMEAAGRDGKVRVGNGAGLVGDVQLDVAEADRQRGDRRVRV
ncbi:hypothetical protein SDJN03_07305, partial [Cucurbita argyrosperma subsp. sororia]